MKMVTFFSLLLQVFPSLLQAVKYMELIPEMIGPNGAVDGRIALVDSGGGLNLDWHSGALGSGGDVNSEKKNVAVLVDGNFEMLKSPEAPKQVNEHTVNEPIRQGNAKKATISPSLADEERCTSQNASAATILPNDADHGSLSALSNGGSMMPPKGPYCLRAFTDVDDTLYALHKKAMGGWIQTYTDFRFEEFTEYAGVRTFYKALSGQFTDGCDQKVHVLSARDEIHDDPKKQNPKNKLKDILGDDYDFGDAGKGKDWTPGKDKYHYVKGSVKKQDGTSRFGGFALKGVMKGDVLNRTMFGLVKAENFQKYITQNMDAIQADNAKYGNKAVIVWNGDNGQGDMCAAQLMIKFAEEKQLKMIANIHKVTDYPGKTIPEANCDHMDGISPKYAFDELVKAGKIVYFWTYPDLAKKLTEDREPYGQILPQAALDAVIEEAKNPPIGNPLSQNRYDVKSFGVPQCQEVFKGCHKTVHRNKLVCKSSDDTNDERKLEYCEKLKEVIPDVDGGWAVIEQRDSMFKKKDPVDVSQPMYRSTGLLESVDKL